MSKSKVQMNGKAQSPKSGNRAASSKEKAGERKPDDTNYDLEERTAVFGERIIDFVKRLPLNVISKELMRQLVPIFQERKQVTH